MKSFLQVPLGARPKSKQDLGILTELYISTKAPESWWNLIYKFQMKSEFRNIIPCLIVPQLQREEERELQISRL